MDKISPLSLHLEEGPRKGEILDCKKKNNIKIGRVVKGNTFTIKEDAISQKHLLIELNNDKKWTVTDLDSSNGTILNNAKLLPHKPCILKDTDIIKIGYETVIRVALPPPTPQKETLKRKRGNHKPNIAAQNPNPNPSPDTNPNPNPNINPNSKAAARRPQSVVGSTDNTVHNSAGQENVNVEEVSLAQWFDQIEEWMPKHLNDVAENIISQMRARSQEFDTHILRTEFGLK